MKKLWQKNKKNLNSIIEAFETRDDLLIDEKLIKYDIMGSLAHAMMLKKIGVLTLDELNVLKKGLFEIQRLNKKNKFKLSFGDEDIHTKIENYLTENYGEVGKKIHTGRSRNDQVLTALRLYYKDQLLQVEKELVNLSNDFKQFSEKYGLTQMVGYTHMQKAMPSSIQIWSDSFYCSLSDDLLLLKSVYKLIDQSPLGSAAGYGVSLNLDKKYTAKLLGFQKVQDNPLYCQNSRGKFEAAILSILVQMLLTINKFASDVMLFSTSEFNYFEVADELTSGSSIMPQKKNIDIAELLRSKVHIVNGFYQQVTGISSNLVSGYNRDLQDTKSAVVKGLEISLESIKISQILIKNLTPKKDNLEKALTDEVFATNKALKLVKQGVSFRTAYQKIGASIVR